MQTQCEARGTVACKEQASAHTINGKVPLCVCHALAIQPYLPYHVTRKAGAK